MLIDARRERDYVRISVSDDGRGIDSVDLQRIFDPFFTTRLAQGGSGLGLSVAHGIIEDHGGEISVESDLLSGTQFEFWLPAVGG